MQVRDIMESPLVGVSEQTPLKDVARLLVERHVTGVPVLHDGRVVGIVSESDIVEVEQAAEAKLPKRHRWREDPLRAAPPPRHVARDVMSSPALSVQAQTSAIGAARLMTSGHVHRLVVVDRGVPVGMITRTDLVRAYTRSDVEIRCEIVREVLPSLDVSPNDVSVSVEGGEVVLRGTVDDDFEAHHLAGAVRRVVGVVGVSCDVRVRTADD